jgi:hypothetical protein
LSSWRQSTLPAAQSNRPKLQQWWLEGSSHSIFLSSLPFIKSFLIFSPVLSQLNNHSARAHEARPCG